MTLEQLNALMAWVREIAEYEAERARASVGEWEDFYVSDRPELELRAKLAEAFGFEVDTANGDVQTKGINAARQARYDELMAASRPVIKRRKAKP